MTWHEVLVAPSRRLIDRPAVVVEVAKADGSPAICSTAAQPTTARAGYGHEKHDEAGQLAGFRLPRRLAYDRRRVEIDQSALVRAHPAQHLRR